MNEELIKQQIKELDTRNKCQFFFLFSPYSVTIILNDLFDIRLNKNIRGVNIACIVRENDKQRLVMYNEVGDNRIEEYLNAVKFFKKNKNKIKAIIKNSLEG